MKLKSLLLGSAAALLTVGGAQAADLGAEPVNYVRVCDAFGAGFYYAPGTDTCIKISGWVRFDIGIGNTPYGGTASFASHAFTMYNQLQVTAASMTEYGPMIGYIAIEQGFFGATGGAGAGISQFIGFDAATLQLGPFSAGWAWSSFSNNIFSTYHNAPFSPLGGNHTLFLQLSWALEGVGLFVAAEDYRTRDFGGAGIATGQIPDFVGGVTFGGSGFNAKVSAGWGDRIVTDTWGVHGELGFGLGQLGNLSLQATYSANADDWACWRVTGACGNAGNFTGAYVGLSTPWTSQLSSLIAGIWYNGPAATFDYTRIIGQLQYTVVPNFFVGAEVSHTMMPGNLSATTGILRIQRNFP